MRIFLFFWPNFCPNIYGLKTVRSKNQSHTDRHHMSYQEISHILEIMTFSIFISEDITFKARSMTIWGFWLCDALPYFKTIMQTPSITSLLFFIIWNDQEIAKNAIPGNNHNKKKSYAFLFNVMGLSQSMTSD